MGRGMEGIGNDEQIKGSIIMGYGSGPI